MLSKLIGVFDDSPADVRGAILGLYALLAAGNLLVWALALRAFHGFPALMGTAVLAYCLGLRHAVDADHIAAIDNVTRKLMQAGKRPVSTGFYFSLGHSTVVFLASLAIAAGAAGLESRFPRLQAVGGVVGTCVSAGFMLLIAFLNIAILRDLHRAFKNVREGGAEESGALEELLKRRGLLGRFFRGAYGLIGRAWHMYPLGFLFGLGFDTATEIGLLGITALEAAKGLPAWSILLFPALFAAGMCLVDASDGVLALAAYGWAFVKPARKLYYNLTVTFVSALSALLVGGLEILGLLTGRLNGDLGAMGWLIIAVLALSWLASTAIYKLEGHDELDAEKS